MAYDNFYAIQFPLSKEKNIYQLHYHEEARNRRGGHSDMACNLAGRLAHAKSRVRITSGAVAEYTTIVDRRLFQRVLSNRRSVTGHNF